MNHLLVFIGALGLGVLVGLLTAVWSMRTRAERPSAERRKHLNRHERWWRLEWAEDHFRLVLTETMGCAEEPFSRVSTVTVRLGDELGPDLNRAALAQRADLIEQLLRDGIRVAVVEEVGT